MRSEGVKRPNVAPYDGAGVFTKVGLSRRATALAVADVTTIAPSYGATRYTPSTFLDAF